MSTTKSQKHPAQGPVETESDKKSVDGDSGKSAGKSTNTGGKSSHDAKSHTKAGKDAGAGGGKKQERHH